MRPWKWKFGFKVTAEPVLYSREAHRAVRFWRLHQTIRRTRGTIAMDTRLKGSCMRETERARMVVRLT